MFLFLLVYCRVISVHTRNVFVSTPLSFHPPLNIHLSHLLYYQVERSVWLFHPCLAHNSISHPQGKSSPTPTPILIWTLTLASCLSGYEMTFSVGECFGSVLADSVYCGLEQTTSSDGCMAILSRGLRALYFSATSTKNFITRRRTQFHIIFVYIACCVDWGMRHTTYKEGVAGNHRLLSHLMSNKQIMTKIACRCRI